MNEDHSRLDSSLEKDSTSPSLPSSSFGSFISPEHLKLPESFTVDFSIKKDSTSPSFVLDPIKKLNVIFSASVCPPRRIVNNVKSPMKEKMTNIKFI